MLTARIFKNIPGKQWNDSYVGSLSFRNVKKILYFCRYYTSKYDCLIKLYDHDTWLSTYRNGRDIWNIW